MVDPKLVNMSVPKGSSSIPGTALNTRERLQSTHTTTSTRKGVAKNKEQ